MQPRSITFAVAVLLIAATGILLPGSSSVAGTGLQTPTPTPTSTGGASPTPTDYPTVCCAAPHFRVVTLRLAGHLEASGRLVLEEGGPAECQNGVPVKLQRKRGDRWRTIARGSTSRTGRFSAADIPDRPGLYRAFAPFVELENGDTCYFAKSRVRRHSH